MNTANVLLPLFMVFNILFLWIISWPESRGPKAVTLPNRGAMVHLLFQYTANNADTMLFPFSGAVSSPGPRALALVPHYPIPAGAFWGKGLHSCSGSRGSCCQLFAQSGGTRCHIAHWKKQRFQCSGNWTLAVPSRVAIGWQSVNSRLAVGWQSVNSWVAVGSESVNSRVAVGWRSFANRSTVVWRSGRPTVGQQSGAGWLKVVHWPCWRRCMPPTSPNIESHWS